MAQVIQLLPEGYRTTALDQQRLKLEMDSITKLAHEASQRRAAEKSRPKALPIGEKTFPRLTRR